MSKGPYSGLYKDPTSPQWEDFDAFIDWVDGEMDRERPQWADFDGVIPDDVLTDMKEKTEEEESQIQEHKSWGTSLLGEWVVLEGVRGGWFGDGKVEAQPASKHDDYFRGIDLICEFPVGDEVIPLAIDVTTANPVNGKDALMVSATIFKKINAVLDRSKKGEHAGAPELFKSRCGSKKAEGRKDMLKAVVVVDPQDVLRMSELSKKAREGDEGALEKLKNDKFRYSFLAQVWAAVEYAQRMAGYVVRDQSRSDKSINLAAQIVRDTGILESVIAEAGEGGEIKIDNELVDMIYNGTVPDKLLGAIKATKLDDLYV